VPAATILHYPCALRAARSSAERRRCDLDDGQGPGAALLRAYDVGGGQARMTDGVEVVEGAGHGGSGQHAQILALRA
jgi:hypothetical protein